MANLQTQTFSIKVFFSANEQPKPDIEECISSPSAGSSVRLVMGSHGISSAGKISITNADGDELRLHDVRLVAGQLYFSNAVERLNREKAKAGTCSTCASVTYQRCRLCGEAVCGKCGCLVGPWAISCESWKCDERLLAGPRRSRLRSV